MQDERGKTARYAERFGHEAPGRNRKAVHRTYANRALVKLLSLEEYEERNTPLAAIAVL
jgi:hypothetical protein